MTHRILGRTGVCVSPLCLGALNFGEATGEADAVRIMHAAFDAGLNFVDTANVYNEGKSEIVVGKGLAGRRDQVILATKVHGRTGDGPNDGGTSRLHILRACDDSLRRLGTDYIDLYQIHRYDYNTPIEETLEALHDLVKSGKVRYIGASSMFAYQFAQSLYLADLCGWTRFVSMQNHYNLIYREEEREMNRLCVEEGVGLIPWSPLARGFLAGNRTQDKSGPTTRARSDEYAHSMYYRKSDFAVLVALEDLAARKSTTPAQLALAWILHKPGVVAPIIGATKMSHLEQAVEALELTLSPEEIEFLETPYVPHPVLGHR